MCLQSFIEKGNKKNLKFIMQINKGVHFNCNSIGTLRTLFLRVYAIIRKSEPSNQASPFQVASIIYIAHVRVQPSTFYQLFILKAGKNSFILDEMLPKPVIRVSILAITALDNLIPLSDSSQLAPRSHRFIIAGM